MAEKEIPPARKTIHLKFPYTHESDSSLAVVGVLLSRVQINELLGSLKRAVGGCERQIQEQRLRGKVVACKDLNGLVLVQSLERKYTIPDGSSHICGF